MSDEASDAGAHTPIAPEILHASITQSEGAPNVASSSPVASVTAAAAREGDADTATSERDTVRLQPPTAPDARSRNVYCASLPHSFSDEDLLALARPFGVVVSARAVPSKKSGRCKGYGFVLFESADSADHCISELHGARVWGHRIQVRRAREEATVEEKIMQRRGVSHEDAPPAISPEAPNSPVVMTRRAAAAQQPPPPPPPPQQQQPLVVGSGSTIVSSHLPLSPAAALPALQPPPPQHQRTWPGSGFSGAAAPVGLVQTHYATPAPPHSAASTAGASAGGSASSFPVQQLPTSANLQHHLLSYAQPPTSAQPPHTPGQYVIVFSGAGAPPHLAAQAPPPLPPYQPPLPHTTAASPTPSQLFLMPAPQGGSGAPQLMMTTPHAPPPPSGYFYHHSHGHHSHHHGYHGGQQHGP